MTRPRLTPVFLVAWTLGAAGACARAVPSQHEQPPPPASAVAPLVDAPRRPGKSLILLAMTDSVSLRKIRHALLNEIKRDFDVSPRVIDPATGTPDFTTDIARMRPA